jgi:hypothetical protein
MNQTKSREGPIRHVLHAACSRNMRVRFTSLYALRVLASMALRMRTVCLRMRPHSCYRLPLGSSHMRMRGGVELLSM